MSLFDMFHSEHVTWDLKNALYILKGSSLEKLMAILWSYYDVLDSEKLGGMYCHGNTLIIRSYPFRQVPSILGSACSWGYWEGIKIGKNLREIHMCMKG